MTLLRYWESVFAASLFGFVTLYPAALSHLAIVGADPFLFMLLSAASVALFLALLLYHEFYDTRRARVLWGSAVLAALSTVCLGVALVFTTPVTAVWFISAALALFSLGFIAAKHFLRRVEHDLNRHPMRVLMQSAGITLAALLLARILTFFPIGLVALIVAGAVVLTTRA